MSCISLGGLHLTAAHHRQAYSIVAAVEAIIQKGGMHTLATGSMPWPLVASLASGTMLSNSRGITLHSPSSPNSSSSLPQQQQQHQGYSIQCAATAGLRLSATAAAGGVWLSSAAAMASQWRLAWRWKHGVSSTGALSRSKRMGIGYADAAGAAEEEEAEAATAEAETAAKKSNPHIAHQGLPYPGAAGGSDRNPRF